MVDSKVHFNIIAEGNSDMEVQQHKVNTSLENLKEVPFTNNSKQVPLALMTLIHPVVRKLFTKEIPICTISRKAITFCKIVGKIYTQPRNFDNGEGVSDTIHKSPRCFHKRVGSTLQWNLNRRGGGDGQKKRIGT